MILPYLLLGFALLLLFLEFFVPSGAFAISGALLLVFSFFAYGAEATPVELLFFTLGAILCIVFVVKLALRLIRKTGKENTLMLDKTQEGYYASQLDPTLMGKTGVTLSDFRPTGKVKVENQIIQASSDQGFLPEGTEVTIVGGSGTHYIVRNMKNGR